MRYQTVILDLQAAKLINEAILQSRSHEENPLVLPDLGFGEGSFITAELAEMFFETIKDWRCKNTPSTKLVIDVLQKWMRYFRKELPEASDQIDLSIEDFKIYWNQKEGKIKTSGGKTELNDDQLSLIQEFYGVGRCMLSRETVYGKNGNFEHFNYLMIYRDKSLRSETTYIERMGYNIEDIPDMDSVFVSGGTEELSKEELEKIAASFYITDFSVDLWNKPDGTKSYELYYGPFFEEYNNEYQPK